MKQILKFTLAEAKNELEAIFQKGSRFEVEVEIILDAENLDKQKYWTVKEVNKKTSEILKELKSKFSVFSYYNDEQLDKYFPIPKVLTERKFKANVEADEDLKNLSVNDLDGNGIEGITLRDRLLLELQYFNETGKHLDIDNITLCSGSRDSDGNVLCVDWYSDYSRLYIHWNGADRPYDNLRARAVVSSI